MSEFLAPTRPQADAQAPTPPTALTSRKPDLLTMPPEIRQKIYELLLLANDGSQKLLTAVSDTDETSWYAIEYNTACMIKAHFEACRDHVNGSWDPIDVRIFPELLSTCKFIYNEAIPILYSKNIFSLCFRCLYYIDKSESALGRLLGSGNLTHIRYIDYSIACSINISKPCRNCDNTRRVCSVLRNLPRLRRVDGISVCIIGHIEERKWEEKGPGAVREFWKYLIQDHPSLRKSYRNIRHKFRVFDRVKILAEGEVAGTAFEQVYPPINAIETRD